MKMILKEHQEEYIKSLNDAQYFLKTYCTIKKKEMVIREVLEGKEYDEVVHIYLKYFTEDEKHREHYSKNIKLLEKVTHSDGDICFVFSFTNPIYDVSKSSIDYDDNYKNLVRKERLDTLRQRLSNIIHSKSRRSRPMDTSEEFSKKLKKFINITQRRDKINKINEKIKNIH